MQVTEILSELNPLREELSNLEAQRKGEVDRIKRELEKLSIARKKIETLGKNGVLPTLSEFSSLEESIYSIPTSIDPILLNSFDDIKSLLDSYGLKNLLDSVQKEATAALGQKLKITCNLVRKHIDIGPFRISFSKDLKGAEIVFGKYRLANKIEPTAPAITRFVLLIYENFLSNPRAGSDVEKDLDEAVRVFRARTPSDSKFNAQPIQGVYEEMKDIVRRRISKDITSKIRKLKLSGPAAEFYQEIYPKAHFALELKNYIIWSTAQPIQKYSLSAAVLDKTAHEDEILWLPRSLDYPGECQAMQSLKIH